MKYAFTVVSAWDTPDGPARLETSGTAESLSEVTAADAEEWARTTLKCPATATHRAFLCLEES